jgi:hypothetical protein
MKKFLKRTGLTLLLISIGWTALTLWAESKGAASNIKFGGNSNGRRALVVYDPDPFYNLDQQVCEAFGKTLAENGWNVTVATVAGLNKQPSDSVDLYVLCANTYNWSPDWSVGNFIKNELPNKKDVVAITLGAGTTGRSKRILESLIKDKGGKLIDSRTFWLWRPNDESSKSNITVATNLTKAWANELANRVKSESD